MDKKFVITLGRTCGAGATFIAQQLSEQLDIPYYDKDIFRMVSDKSGVLENYYRLNNERPGNNLLYKMVKELYPASRKPSIGKDIVSPENLFRFQAEVIKELAENETCIVVGRGADFILKDYENVVNIFVCGSWDSRLKRIMETYDMKEAAATQYIKDMDKQRTKFYNYYSGGEWQDPANYDICLNTSTMTIEEATEVVKNLLQVRGLIEA